MSNRKDFYFEQLVTQADMDSVFDYCEAADQNIQADNGYIGVVSGLELVENNPTPDLTVDIAGGTAYDQDGQRINIAATQSLDLSIDSNAVSTAVAGGGNEKWVSVFVAFDRVLSDPRVDGNGTPLYYERTESFQFVVDQGSEAAAGSPAVYTAGRNEPYGLANGQTLEVVVDNTPAVTVTFLTGDFATIATATAAEVAAVIQASVPGVTAADAAGYVAVSSRMTGSSASVRITGGTAFATFQWPSSASVGSGGPSRPALRSDALLLADVLMRNGSTEIVDAPDPGGGEAVIDAYSRRQFVFVYNGSQFTIKEGTITDFGTALAQEVTNHIAEVGSSHPASAILYDPTVAPVPAAWSAVTASSEVQTAVDSIIDDLVQTTAPSGASLIGVSPVSGVSGSPTTVQAVLESIFQGPGTTEFSNDVLFDGTSVIVGGQLEADNILFSTLQRITSYSGNPEGFVTATAGSLCFGNSTVYFKGSGSGNTGWLDLQDAFV